jgi:hypothetical protein
MIYTCSANIQQLGLQVEIHSDESWGPEHLGGMKLPTYDS